MGSIEVMWIDEAVDVLKLSETRANPMGKGGPKTNLRCDDKGVNGIA